MPELPEVETVRRVLAPQLVGKRIAAVEVRAPAVVARPDAAAFCAALAGQRFARLTRRGKFLTLHLESGDAVRLHLRMTGCLLAAPSGWPEEAHTHLVFRLEDGTELRFSDQRRFGRFWLLRAGEADVYSGQGQLGPEPDDPALTPAYLRARLGRSGRAIKTCLLDQSAVAGIGNICSDEILFAARLRPDRPARTLSEAEWARLAQTIPEKLAFLTEKNAISAADYLADRGDYRNTPWLRVYGHGGEPCPDCGAPLQRAVIGGRSAVFCPRCQPETECCVSGKDRATMV